MTTIVRRRKLGLKSIVGITAASTTGIGWCNNYEQIVNDEVYIRWGCTSTVPNPDAKIINSAASIHRISDKSGFRKVMNDEGRVLAPPTFFRPDTVPNEYVESGMVTRPQHHAQGRNLTVTYNYPDLQAAMAKAGPNSYTSLLIRKVAEFRVFIHQGRVVWVAKKTPADPEAVAWNVAKGGRFDNVRWDDWNVDVVNNALEVWELTKAHFAGIDIMLDERGNAWCVEANSAPSQTSPYRQSCVAKAFDYMIRNQKYERRIFNPVHVTNWKDVIHPGVWNRE